ncbi:hypothetical protein SAMN06297144_1908 [Sphingomonas guangdongensis]|uniref:Uncharacterized protein n=1 Tax=Sphingomonas guangdongensis TaxID=1141890 RepID=A0A285QZ84_9SPHN|nr:hypothetical protein [Sphingomonas guangdongensis]SOB86798.1 hypothetical protein SAMN06297144_1908 [Sphingomonas guangdongensis]
MRERFRKVARAGCLVLLIAAGCAVLWGVLELRKHQRRDAADRTLNGEGVISPSWRVSGDCRPRTTAERSRDEAVADLLHHFDHQRVNPGLGYKEQYFAWRWRIAGSSGSCSPSPEHYRRLAGVLVPLGWPKLPTDRSDLELTRRLPPSPALARNLAELAFASHPLPFGPLEYDNRPFARIMLAEQGRFARPWGRRALTEIAPDTKLGTSAATLAAATVPQQAAPRIAAALTAMTQEADRRRKRIEGLKGGPHIVYQLRDGERLFELADALATAGPAAEPHAEPLGQTFGSGSHFGLLPAEPTYLCAAADRIGGRAAVAASRASFCRTPALAPANGAR